MSSSFFLIVASEIAFLFQLLLISLVDVLAPDKGKVELLKLINLSLLLSEIGSVLDNICFSWSRRQTIRPLFHPGKQNEDDKLSFKNE